MAILTQGELLGQYRVQNLIKTNTYTETYRVESMDHTPYFLKLFVLKRLPQQLLNGETKKVKEIEYAQILSHKNIVSYIDSGEIEREESNCQYYITSYFNGSLLIDRIQREGCIPENEAIGIFRGILEALGYLHHQSVALCHNDVNPTNIILSSVNGAPELIDLGHISERTYGSVWFNTSDIDPLYHANETRVSIFDEQSDIFSACAVLYAMLTGKAPWDIEIPQEGTYKERFAELHTFRKSHKIDFSALQASDKIKTILERGLQLKNIDRYQSVDEIIQTLDAETTDSPSTPRDSSTGHNSHSTTDRSHHQSPNYVEFPIKKGAGNGFEDIAGMAELKDTLTKKVIFVIKNKDIAEQYRILPPNGMLLYGPPGCGKTFFAEKFAEETGFSYLLVKSSDLASSFVHGSQEKIRQLFDQAEKNAPIVVCFDEFDALVPDRSWNNVSAEEVNEFLSQMNNCAKRGIFIVATSNRPDKIDKAILRTGRIDQKVFVPLPDYSARKEMFSLYLKNRPAADDINLDELTKLTDGYIASDIAYIVNDAAMVAAFTREKITMQLLLNSIKATPPSLGKDSLEQYETIRKQMEDINRRNSIERTIVSPW